MTADMLAANLMDLHACAHHPVVCANSPLWLNALKHIMHRVICRLLCNQICAGSHVHYESTDASGRPYSVFTFVKSSADVMSVL